MRQRKAGVVVHPGNVSELEAAVRTLVSDPDVRTEYDADGRRAAVERFDRHRVLPTLSSRNWGT